MLCTSVGFSTNEMKTYTVYRILVFVYIRIYDTHTHMYLSLSLTICIYSEKIDLSSPLEPDNP